MENFKHLWHIYLKIANEEPQNHNSKIEDDDTRRKVKNLSNAPNCMVHCLSAPLMLNVITKFC